ncbi:MAG: hypothetical protein LBN43_05235 [Oscillospiraceae bacterium]|jgi:hypothetical protein|nr:hypothetical protein [Oscillospiraceae bacterium]
MKNLKTTSIALIAAMLISLTAPIAANAKLVVVDYALYTDIVTYINGSAIRSYNIKGYTAVVAEDLSDYGFEIIWYADERELYVSLALNPAERTAKYTPEEVQPSQIGQRAKQVFATDIVCKINGEVVNSYNIGGETIIYVDDLASKFDCDYVWSQGARTLQLDLIKPWATMVYNDGYDYETKDGGFSFTFANVSEPGGEANFKITDATGAHAIFKSVSLSYEYVSFSIYAKSFEYGFNADFYNALSQTYNFNYGERVKEDTPERRAEVSDFLRVYVNGSLIGGEVWRGQGSNHSDYEFRFDNAIELDQVSSIRLEVGNDDIPFRTFEEEIDAVINLEMFHVYERFDCKDYSVIYGATQGIMHAYSFMFIVYRTGGRAEVLQQLPQNPEGWHNDFDIRDLKLSDDESTITFTRTFEGKEYYYSVNLAAAIISEIPVKEN